jgi:hypothetical protein
MVAHLAEFVTLWNLVRQTNLQPPQQADSISWTLTQLGHYSTSSAYKAQFHDRAANPVLPTIWKSWSPPKCKFFAWLILQDRVWTSDRLARRNWDHIPVCVLCRAVLETALHLLAECRYTRRVWALVVSWVGSHDLEPEGWTPSPLQASGGSMPRFRTPLAKACVC